MKNLYIGQTGAKAPFHTEINTMENLDEAHYEEVNSEEAEKLCEENGLRYIGRDPYNNNSHHAARWLDSNCSVTIGHFDNRVEFYDLIEGNAEWEAERAIR